MENSECEILAMVFEQETKWLCNVIKHRIKFFFNNPNSEPIQTVSPNDFKNIETTYTNFLAQYNLSFEERLLFFLAIVPHIKPYLLQEEFTVYGMKRDNYSRNIMVDYAREYPEICLVSDRYASGVLPTGLTFLFLIAGRNVAQRLKAASLFKNDSTLIKEKVIHLESTEVGNIFYSGRIILSEAYFEMFVSTRNT